MSEHLDVIRQMYDQFVEERARKLRSIEDMSSGGARMHQNHIDVTAQWIETLQSHVTELDGLIADVGGRYGFPRA